MPPALTRLSTPVRAPSFKDCDPARLVVPSSCILNPTSLSSSSSASSSGLSSPHSNDQVAVSYEKRGSSVRLAHTPTGKRWEFSIKDGVVLTKQVDVVASDDSAKHGRASEDEADEEYDVSEDAHLCEAVLRSLLAPAVPAEPLEDRIALAEFVKHGFALNDDSVMQTVVVRAKKAAQYRTAELQVMHDELQKDESRYMTSDQFDDPQLYEKWKESELHELSVIITSLSTLPAFSGSVKLDLISIEDVKPVEVSCISRCRKQPPRPRVYASVTVLPSRSSSGKDLDNEPAPAFTSEAVVCTGVAKWQTTTSWIPVTSVQDKVLIEVWDRQVLPKKKGKSKAKLKLSSRNIKLPKVAPNGDAFVGQVIVTFGQVESESLRPGGLQGAAPSTAYMLADEKGREINMKIHLRFSCSSERCYKDMPSNKLLLRPPVADVVEAFDMLVNVALRSQNEEIFELEEQWRSVLNKFGAHYRLRTQRCSLGIVNNLAQRFQQDLGFLGAIVYEWSPLCEAARLGLLTKDELLVHSNVVSLLAKPAIDAIENFQAVFPKNQPAGALTNLLKLLGLVLRWDPNPNEILIPLKSWIKNSCENRFHYHLFGDRPSSDQPTNITSQSLTSVVNLVRMDLAELPEYAEAFPGGISLAGVAIPAYYKLVSGYVMNAIRAAEVKMFTKEDEELVLELLSFHKDIEKMGQQCELMDLHGIFKEHIVKLVGAARTRMIDWVGFSVTTEKWEPTSPQTGALFSFSFTDVYFMLGQVMDQLLTTLTAVPFGRHHFNQVEDAICSAVKTYIDILELLCLQEIPDVGSKSSEGSAVCISMSVCVKINNMVEVLEQHDLEKRLNETVQSSEDEGDDARLSLLHVVEKHSSVKDELSSKFKEVQQYTRQSLNNVIESIVEVLQARLAGELTYVLQAAPSCTETVEQQLKSLQGYLDEHLITMNSYLHPTIFKRMLSEICRGLIFCMEEYALNKDEDPTPMTKFQRDKLEEILDYCYLYFYGDGVGIDSEQMDALSARLRSILSCWDLNTRELCALYWRAWDDFNDGSSDCSTSTLHLLDYLWILRQRTDDEACEIVDRQQFIANKRMMQFMFGLPKEEELVAAYCCRNVHKAQGTMYITSKHICFKDTKRALADSRMLFSISIDRLMRIELPGRNSIVLIPFHQRHAEFSKFSDRDAVCRTIFSQVVGTGYHLEKNMAPMWSDRGIQRSLEPDNAAIKVFKCCKQGLLQKYCGTMVVSAAFILFTQDDKTKVIQLNHTNISRIHAERRGLRPSGVVIELKNGDEFEFCNFQAVKMSHRQIARELHMFVFGTQSLEAQ